MFDKIYFQCKRIRSYYLIKGVIWGMSVFEIDISKNEEKEIIVKHLEFIVEQLANR